MNQYQFEERLGELPLIRRWQNVPYYLSRGLEQIQRKLYKEQQRTDGEVAVNSKFRMPWHRYQSNSRIHFDPTILPHWEAFARTVKERKGLTRFSIDNIVLPPSFVNAMMEPIMTSNSESLTCLELTSVELSSNDIVSIAEIISKLPLLATLDLSSNKICDVSAAESLAVAMNNHENLCLANFSRCDLGKNMDILTHVLDGVPNMKTILLERNEIKTAEGVKLVADFIENNATVTVMNLEGNFIGDANAKLLGEALNKNTQISSLGLGFNDISIISPIIDSKRAIDHLTHLDLSTHRWGRSGRINSMEESELIADNVVFE